MVALMTATNYLGGAIRDGDLPRAHLPAVASAPGSGGRDHGHCKRGQTYRVGFIPQPLMGRVAAAFRAVTWATLPIGSLLGGILATTTGVQHTIFIGSTISFCAILWLGTRVQSGHENRLAGAA
jgi:hypothetical protein